MKYMAMIIDEKCRHHYYARMKFTITSMLIISLCLTACGKRPLESQTTAKPSRTILSAPGTAKPPAEEATTEPSTEEPLVTDGASAVGQDADILATTQDGSQLENSTTLSEQESELIQPAGAIAGPSQVLPEDVFDRMRRGFTLPRFDSKDVDTYLRWNTNHETYLNSLFRRAQPFLPHIIGELEARNMPMEIALLPAVESAYKPTAVSKSKAAGLWQFIPSTGRHFGLEQNWWYDGRLDAVRATTAALDYLQQLNSMFNGDWWLTLAAYNAGPGNIKRAIAENRRKGLPVNYRSLRLRSETRRYIPKLVALRRIIQQPHNFNVNLPRLPLQAGFTTIALDQQIDLRKFALESNTDLKQLRHLNASYKRWATPPTGQFALLVPQPHTLDIYRLTEIARNESGISYLRHQINEGENLGSIAQKYGVSTTEIRKANQLKSSFIRAGHTLLVPKIDSANGSSLSSRNASQNVTHTVRAGDTLWSISRRYNVGVQQLLEWNQLAAGQILRLNQQLLVLLK